MLLSFRLVWLARILFFFFFNDTATTEIYTLSLHDALPIWWRVGSAVSWRGLEEPVGGVFGNPGKGRGLQSRSEEHTSELQSQSNLVCRLLLEKKKKNRVTLGHRVPYGERWTEAKSIAGSSH